MPKFRPLRRGGVEALALEGESFDFGISSRSQPLEQQL